MLPMAMQCRAQPRYCDFHPSWSDADAFPPPPSSQATGDVRRGKGKNKEKGQPLNTNEFSEAQREPTEAEKGMNSLGERRVCRRLLAGWSFHLPRQGVHPSCPRSMDWVHPESPCLESFLSSLIAGLLFVILSAPNSLCQQPGPHW